MKPYNISPVNTRKTAIKKSVKKPGKRKSRPGMFSNDRTGSKELAVPVGNVAPWTTGSIPTGRANSKANLPRQKKTKVRKKGARIAPAARRTPVRNRAPRARTPIMGNTNNAGMWGM